MIKQKKHTADNGIQFWICFGLLISMLFKDKLHITEDLEDSTFLYNRTYWHT